MTQIGSCVREPPVGWLLLPQRDAIHQFHAGGWRLRSFVVQGAADYLFGHQVVIDGGSPFPIHGEQYG
jgi:hypothetical protein